MSLHLNTAFLLRSIDAWEQDREKRFNLASLTESFHESVPILDFLDWKITAVKRGYTETVLPLTPNASNQHISHQAALMLLAADYTGGLALASLLHMVPVIGFWPSLNDSAAYMWGAKAFIHWFAPSCHNLTCKAKIEKDKWDHLAKRFANSDKVVVTIPIKMFNGEKLVAEADFTYWTQDINGMKRNAFDATKINALYEYKTKTTAKLIAGLRALEQEKPNRERRFDDPYAFMLAGKHGITLARRFSINTPQLQNMVAARTLHLDKIVTQFSKKTDLFNVVNIGVGYDSRFWRLNIENAFIYDLDLPVMLNERKRIFDYCKNKMTQSIDIDLQFQPIDVALREKCKFDPFLPTFFIWEGGSMYFQDEDINTIFTSIKKIMSYGSCIWFDYVSKDLIEDATSIKEAEEFMKNMRKMGESFINGYNNIRILAEKHHLKIQQDICSGTVLNTEEAIYKHYGFCTLRGE